MTVTIFMVYPSMAINPIVHITDTVTDIIDGKTARRLRKRYIKRRIEVRRAMGRNVLAESSDSLSRYTFI
jgi:hypothetical protein